MASPKAYSTRGSRRRERFYYVGRRAPAGEVYVVGASAVEPLEHHRHRSGAAFDWGAASAGALELAFAILAHGTGSRPPDPICAAFWSDIVSRLDPAGFVLGYGEVALWLLTAFPEPGGRR